MPRKARGARPSGIESVTLSAGGKSVTVKPEEIAAEAQGAAGPVRDFARDLIEEALGPRAQVNIELEGEDLRALIERCLLFVGTGKDVPDSMRNIRIDITEQWAFGFAGDGYRACLQKMRCRADGAGLLVLTPYDAVHILSMIPKPRGESLPERVRINFVSGGAPELKRPVNVTYEEYGRVATYACESASDVLPASALKVLQVDAHAEGKTGRFAMQPAFLASVAKAAEVAKDQPSYVVRWYELHDGGLIARFMSGSEKHDEFVARLMPLSVTWNDEDALAAVSARIRDGSTESEPLRPKAEGLPL